MSSFVESSKRPAVKVFVATTVMLTFISFWRAAAIVLADLASSAYYAGGDAEQVIGKSAPWFILAVMLFSYAVRALYIESSSMFVRGGVYRVVKEAMGGTLAKFSVSALLFDYVLTGPISAVSAGQYLAGFHRRRCAPDRPSHGRFPGQYLRRRVRRSDCALFLVEEHPGNSRVQPEGRADHGDYDGDGRDPADVVHDHGLAAAPFICRPVRCTPGVVPLNKQSLGWLNGTWISQLTWIIMFVGFGHSVLAMSGEETLAQVNREIEHPKLKNLEKTGLVIFIYSLLFTSLVSFFAVMIIPDSVRPQYFGNLIGGIAMYLVGPTWARLIFRGLCCAGRSADSGGRAEYVDRRRQRCAEPDGGRRGVDVRAAEAPSTLRHQLPDYQPGGRHAGAHHHCHRRKRIRAWRACMPSA